MKKKFILLKLAELLTGSDDSMLKRIGYLVRKWNDRRIPKNQKKEIRDELDRMQAKIANQRQVFRTPPLSGLHVHSSPQLDLQLPNILNRWPYFTEVFMISALTGEGIEKLHVSTVYYSDMSLLPLKIMNILTHSEHIDPF